MSRLWQLVLTCSAPMPKCPQLPKNPIYPSLCVIIPIPLPAAEFIASPRSSSKPVSVCHFTPTLSLPGLQGVSQLTATFLPCHLLRYLYAQAASSHATRGDEDPMLLTEQHKQAFSQASRLFCMIRKSWFKHIPTVSWACYSPSLGVAAVCFLCMFSLPWTKTLHR